MTDERARQDPAEFMQRLLAEAELDRLVALPPAQLRKELDEAGIPPGWGQDLMREVLAKADTIDPKDVPGVEDPPAPPVVQKGSAGAEVVRLDERRRARARTFALLAAAAIVLLVIGVVWRQNPMIRERIDAWFSPKPTAPIPTQPPLVPPTQEETPKDKAARLREEAFVDVQGWYFDEAWDKLQDAKELDPAGDADPKVQQAYQEIAAGYPKPQFRTAKPGVQPFERPLEKH